jgi:hypothetical protein
MGTLVIARNLLTMATWVARGYPKNIAMITQWRWKVNINKIISFFLMNNPKKIEKIS